MKALIGLAGGGLTLLIGFSGGLVFSALGLPLPWTLGAMAAVGAVASLGRRATIPPLFGKVARPVVGVLAGSAFTPHTLGLFATWWDGFLIVGILTGVLTLAGYSFFRFFGKLDRTTAFFASAPGGLSELSLLGASLGGNMRSLVLIHSFRIVAIISVVPVTVQYMLGRSPLASLGAAPTSVSLNPGDWLILLFCALFGYWVAKVTRFPGGVMIPTMGLSALVHALGLTDVAPPSWVVAGVQVIIGSISGARFSGVNWIEMRVAALLGLAWAVILLVLTYASALAASLIISLPFTTLLLALAPGGMAEMTVVVYALGIDVAFVIACQVCRVFTVLTFVPLLSRFFSEHYVK